MVIKEIKEFDLVSGISTFIGWYAKAILLEE